MFFHLHPSGNQEASCDVRRQLFVVGFVGPDKPTTQRGAAATAAAAADMTSSTCAMNRRSVSITVALTPTLRRHFQAALENDSTFGTTTTTHLLEGVRRALIDKDEDVRVDYALAFDVCEALRTKGLSRDAYVSKSVTASDVDFAVVQERRSLTESEATEKREHEALMRRVRRELEEREYDAMTRDVARTASNLRHIRNDESGLSKSSADARAYGLAVHVLSVMFAFVCAGYAAGGAVDQRLGTVSARGLLAALGAALGLLVETGLLILRDSRASSSPSYNNKVVQ